MITVNELTNMQCHKRAILEPLTILLAPFAPHMAEELWQVALGHKETVTLARFPEYDEKYLKDDSFVYPVAINGKTRTECRFSLEATQQEIEETILANEIVQKWMEGKKPKKVIYVKGRMINVVV
jgi:leucyl-tRNA synthetase